MREENEKSEFSWLESETPKRTKKARPAVWIGIPFVLFLIFCFAALGMFGMLALVPIGIVAMLWFRFRNQAVRFPAALYVLVFLLLALATWDFLSDGPVISNPIASRIYQTGIDLRDRESTVLVTDDDFKPAPAKAPVVTDTVQEIAPESAAAEPVVPPAQPAVIPAKPQTETPANQPTTGNRAFDTFLNEGLKAVEEEEYGIANQSFRNAFKASPGHPRLKELAAEFKREADKKCQDFKAANAKELRQIPNIYYQYAASLTQTVPLKCE